MTKAPDHIWICVSGKEPPDWIVERMVTADIAPDGSFDIEASDGPVRVERGFAVFSINGGVYACPPRLVPEKVANATGEELPTPKPQEPRAAAPAPASSAEKPVPVLKFKEVIGDPPAPQFVSPRSLLVDDSYQRSIEGGASQKLIEKIAVNWDWRLCLPLLVSRRDGALYVIDGQHRLEGAKLRGDIPHLPVVIFDFGDPKAEAELFVAANRVRRPMQQLDDFHAAVAAGDKKMMAVNDLVVEAGLVVGRNHAWQQLRPGEVVFIRSVARQLKNMDRTIPLAALTTLGRAFEGTPLIAGGAIFEGLCTIIGDAAEAGQPIELDLMQTVLTEVGIPGWKDAVAGVDSGYDRAEAMLRALRNSYDEARGEG